MTEKLIILGAIGNCIDILDTVNDINRLSSKPKYECVGFLDDDESKWQQSICNVPVLGGLSTAKSYKDAFFINGIGSPKSFQIRKKLVERLGLSVQRFATIIHPTASVSRLAKIGRGNIIFQNVTITTNVIMGDHICVLPASVISHDCRIGSYTCIAGGVIISGNVNIGESCYLGAGSTIKESICIGDNSLIGMGSVVLKDVKGGSVVAGNPTRVLDIR
jgi:sugar O-acyltransferase (sialic acid O-acetyltransferase NeuD family)